MTESSNYNHFPNCLPFCTVNIRCKTGRNYETEQYGHLFTFLVNIYMKYYIEGMESTAQNKYVCVCIYNL